MASSFAKRFWHVAKMNDSDIYRLANSKSEFSHPARLALMINARYNKRAVKDDDKWVTINGTHVMIGEGGNIKSGPSRLRAESQAPKSEAGEGMKKPSSPSGTKAAVKPSKHRAVSSRKFVPALDRAKSSCPPEYAWRVDSSRKAEDFDKDSIRMHVTEGGSTFALKPDGDIVSVCKNHNGSDYGTEVMAAAVKAGGDHLDSFDGNYRFYTKCGFEVVSRCKFDEQYAPDGWVKGRDDPEDVIFMVYRGPGKTKDKSIDDMRKRVPYSASYDEAASKCDEEVARGKRK